MIAAVLKEIIFAIFAFGAILSSLVVITSRNPVKGVLCLVLTFIATAGVWILLQAQFLGLILIVVYVGAVMTLFLFVVMMLTPDRSVFKQSLVRYMPIGLIILLMILVMLILVLAPFNVGLQNYASPSIKPVDYNSAGLLGQLMYTHYVFAFEVAGALLLSAMIAAISIAHVGHRRRRVVKVSDQLKVDPRDRIHLVKMKVEKGDK
jgi:NADH-quinone oxidoreductase subunit J